MTQDKPERVATTSADILNENLHKLQVVFPQFVKESQVDFDALQTFFDKEGILAGPEKYGLSWAGKGDAFKAIRVPATGTLVPDERGVGEWDKTQNIFIEGDNLEVLKLLQKHYREQIKMIYIDPPYNTGKDFIYKDNFTENKSDYYERTGQSEGGVKLTSNPESNGRYHSDWLTMMYPRLFLAKNLLKEDGVIFISIDDNEVANLRLIMDEIFGEENFIDCLIWKKRYGGGSKEKYLVTVHEYVLFYAKNLSSISEIEIPLNEESIKRYYTKKDSNFESRGPYRTHPLEAGRAMDDRANLIFSIKAPDGSEVLPRRQWLWSKDRVEDALKFNELEFIKTDVGWSIGTKQYLKDREGNIRDAKAFSMIDDIFTQHGTNETIELFGDARIFSYPKPSSFIRKLLEIGSDKEALVLDFFAGSGTTAHAVMAQNAEDGGNRKWICVQLPESTDPDSEAFKSMGLKTIADISRERIERAGVYLDNAARQPDSGKRRVDIGFKSFALSESNYRQWSVLTEKDDEEKLKAQMKLFAEKPLVDKSDEKSVVYEVLLKEGFSLNVEVKREERGGVALWLATSGDRTAAITLAPKLSRERVDALGLAKDALFVCLDSALDDSLKVNLSKNFNLKVI